MKHVSLTEKGLRPHNEDAVLTRFDPRYPLLAAVSDGMGGHAAGDVASRITIETLNTWTRELCDSPKNMLIEAFCNANDQVLFSAGSDSARSGMGATLVAAVFYNDHFITANVGDSRLYLYSNGSIRQITYDHSYVQELVRMGYITDAQARTHPRRNVITRCIGSETSFEPDVFYTQWQSGDTAMLCSDGLCGVLANDALARCFLVEPDLEALAKKLVEKALLEGSTDNITLALVRNEGGVEL